MDSFFISAVKIFYQIDKHADDGPILGVLQNQDIFTLWHPFDEVCFL